MEGVLPLISHLQNTTGDSSTLKINVWQKILVVNLSLQIHECVFSFFSYHVCYMNTELKYSQTVSLLIGSSAWPRGRKAAFGSLKRLWKGVQWSQQYHHPRGWWQHSCGQKVTGWEWGVVRRKLDEVAHASSCINGKDGRIQPSL